MIEPIEGAPRGVVAMRAVGRISGDDYETVLRPAIDAAIDEHGKARIVLELGPAFEGYSADAAWEDMKLGAAHLSSWERCAVVTDHAGIGDAVRVIGLLMPGTFKAFPVADLEAAMSWAAAETGR
jgi:hypothetical protein